MFVVVAAYITSDRPWKHKSNHVTNYCKYLSNGKTTHQMSPYTVVAKCCNKKFIHTWARGRTQYTDRPRPPHNKQNKTGENIK